MGSHCGSSFAVCPADTSRPSTSNVQVLTMSIQFQSQNFQHILRMCNTNVDGRQKVMFALTAIKGIGRRISNIICKKCDIDLNKRAGELTTDDVNKIVAVMSSPLQFKVLAWFLNRRKDLK